MFKTKENPTADLPIDEPGDNKNFQSECILVPSGNQDVLIVEADMTTEHISRPMGRPMRDLSEHRRINALHARRAEYETQMTEDFDVDRSYEMGLINSELADLEAI